HLEKKGRPSPTPPRASRPDPPLPLFPAADAERALPTLEPVPFGARVRPVSGAEVRFARAGHIVGAALVECAIGGRRVVFSGDLGRYGKPIIADPDPVVEADVLLVESTYRHRLHP